MDRKRIEDICQDISENIVEKGYYKASFDSEEYMVAKEMPFLEGKLSRLFVLQIFELEVDSDLAIDDQLMNYIYFSLNEKNEILERKTYRGIKKAEGWTDGEIESVTKGLFSLDKILDYSDDEKWMMTGDYPKGKYYLVWDDGGEIGKLFLAKQGPDVFDLIDIDNDLIIESYSLVRGKNPIKK